MLWSDQKRENYHRLQWVGHDGFIQAVANVCGTGEALLDLGCGTGVMEKHLSGVPLSPAGLGDITPKLLLKDVVVVPEFLLLGEANPVILGPSVAIAVHARCIELATRRVLRDVCNRDTHPAGQLEFRTEITRHSATPEYQL